MRTPWSRAAVVIAKQLVAGTTLILVGVATARAVLPQAAQRTGQQAQSVAGKTRGIRNPRELRAMQLLERDQPELAPHVRFEWEQVPGAREYLLSGHWATAQAWTMQSRQFRVTPGSATSWQRDRVSFDVALPQGSHSWNLVALFGPEGAGDFAMPAPISFALR